MLSDLLLKDFLKETASKNPVPGGGSMAALSGAAAAALTEMVANLTIGRKKYDSVQEKMMSISEEMKTLRESFILYIDKDADAYTEVMNAYKLDASKEEEKRRKTIQKALQKAAEIPLRVAEDAYKLMEKAETAVKEGNKNAATDGMVGVMMARTAALSAILNVKINLKSIEDEAFNSSMLQKVEALEQKVIQKETEILDSLAF